jgi:hypothetical protein
MIGLAYRTQIHSTKETLRHSLTQPGQASFAGGGPHGGTCEGCKFFEPHRKHRGTCGIYRVLMPHVANAPHFDADASACKYFDNNKEVEVCATSTVVFLPLTPRQRISSAGQSTVTVRTELK